MLLNRYALGLIIMPLLFAAVYFISETFKLHFSKFTLLDWSSLLSFYLTAVGVVYSYIAVLKVSEISARYYIKLTFPAASKRLRELYVRLPQSQNLKCSELLSRSHFVEIPVSLKALRVTRGHDLKDVIVAAEASYKALSKWMKLEENLEIEVKNCKDFWALVERMGIMSEAIKNFIHEDGARQ